MGAGSGRKRKKKPPAMGRGMGEGSGRKRWQMKMVRQWVQAAPQGSGDAAYGLTGVVQEAVTRMAPVTGTGTQLPQGKTIHEVVLSWTCVSVAALDQRLKTAAGWVTSGVLVVDRRGVVSAVPVTVRPSATVCPHLVRWLV